MAVLTFKIGTEDFDALKLAKVANANMALYAQNEKMTDDERRLFELAMEYTINGIQDGSIKNISVSGNMSDSKGLGNAMMGLAIRYLRQLANDSGAQAIKYTKKKYNKNLEDAFKEHFNAGNDLDDAFIENWNNKDYRTKLLDAANFLLDRINRINKGEDDMEGIDSSAEINNLNAALAAIRDGKVEDGEFSAFDKIGWSGAKKLLVDGKLTKTPSWEKELRDELKADGMSDEDIEELIALKRESRQWDREDARTLQLLERENRINDRYSKENHNRWLTFANSTYNKRFDKKWKLGQSSFKDAESYERAIKKLNINPGAYFNRWLQNPEGITGQYKNSDWLKNFLAYTASNSEYEGMYTADTKSGSLIINNSLNTINGRALAYNPSTGVLHEVSPEDSEELRELLHLAWLEKHPDLTVGNGSKRAIFSKEGGVLGYLVGGSFVMPNVLENAKANVAAADLKALKTRASLAGRTAEKLKLYEDYMEGNGEFNEADKLRLVNLINDISSIGTSYIPVYGTAVAGAQGLASMGLDLLADIKDENVSRELVWDNLKMNAGIAALGMLPGGTGKIGKVWKSFKKLLPMGLSAYGLTETITDPEVKKSLDKLIKSGEANELNNKDWKNLMLVAKMVAFGHNTAKATSQAYNQTLKNSSWTPSLMRTFGEKSIGSDKARALNTKLVQLGSLENIGKEAAEVAGVAGKKLTLNVEGGTLEVTLKKSAYKLLNDAIKDEKDATKALTKINETINNWLKNNPENYFLKSKDLDFSKIKGTGTTTGGEEIKGLNIEVPSGKNLYEYLEGLGDTKKVTLKSGDNTFKDIAITDDNIRAFQNEILKEANIEAKDITESNPFGNIWKNIEADKRTAAEKAAQALVDSLLPLKTPIVETPGAVTAVLNAGDINMPNKVTGWVGKHPTIKLEDAGPSLGKLFEGWTGEGINAINPFIVDKYTGDSNVAHINRIKNLRARELENQYGSSLGNLFNNNWEMANGAGPFRFGINGSATTKEYLNALEKEHDALTYGDDIAKWKSEKIGDVEWKDSKIGKEWLELENKLGRKLNTEEGKVLYDKFNLLETLKKELANEIAPNGTLNESFKNELKLIFDDANGKSDSEILKSIKSIIDRNDKAGKKTGAELLLDLLELKAKGASTLEEANELKDIIHFNNKFKDNVLLVKDSFEDELTLFKSSHPDSTKFEELQYMKNWLDKLIGNSFGNFTLSEILKPNKDLLLARFKKELQIIDPSFDLETVKTPELLTTLLKNVGGENANTQTILDTLNNIKNKEDSLGRIFSLSNIDPIQAYLSQIHTHIDSTHFLDELKNIPEILDKIKTHDNALSNPDEYFRKLTPEKQKLLLLLFYKESKLRKNIEYFTDDEKLFADLELFKFGESSKKKYDDLYNPLSNDAVESLLGIKIGGDSAFTNRDLLQKLVGDGKTINKATVEPAFKLLLTEHPSYAGKSLAEITEISNKLETLSTKLGINKKTLGDTFKGSVDLLADLTVLEESLNKLTAGDAIFKNLTYKDPITGIDTKFTSKAEALKLIGEGLVSINDVIKLADARKVIESVSTILSKNKGKKSTISKEDKTKLKVLETYLKDPEINLEQFLDTLKDTEFLNNYSKFFTKDGKVLKKVTEDDAIKFLTEAKKLYEFKKGGTISYLKSLKQGGNIRKFSDGGSNNMGFSNGSSNWRTNIFDKYSQDILDKINSKSGKDLDYYLHMINTMLDNHAKLYNKYGSDYSGKVNFDLDVLNYLNYYDNYNEFGYNKRQGVDAINQAVKAGRYKAYGNTTRTSGDGVEGSFKNDGLYGAITDDRRILGRLSSNGEDDWDEQSLTEFNKKLSAKGLKMFRDKNNYYKIGKITGQESNNLTSYSEGDLLHPTNKTVESLKNIGQETLKYFGEHKDDFMEIGKYLNTLRTNKLNKDLLLKAASPALNGYLNAHETIKTDDIGKLYLELELNRLKNLKLPSSNGSLVAADKLEKATKALDTKLKFNALDALNVAKLRAESDTLLRRLREMNQATTDSNLGKEKAAKTIAANVNTLFNLANNTAFTNLADIFIAKDRQASVQRALKKAYLDLYNLTHAFDNELSLNPKLKSKYDRYKVLNDKYAKNDIDKKESSELESLGTYLTEQAKTINKNATYKYLGYTPPEEKQGYNFTVAKKGGVLKHSISYSADKYGKLVESHIQNNVKSYEKAASGLSLVTLLALKKMLDL